MMNKNNKMNRNIFSGFLIEKDIKRYKQENQ